MLSISNALKKQSVSGVAAPACKIKIKLKSGKELVLTQSDLWEGGFSMDDATSRAGSFDIGQVITNRLKLSLDDSEEQYSVYDFLDAEATAWRGGILQDGTTELLQCGSFLVQQQSNPDSSVDLTCLDNMCRTEIPYSEVSTAYPATIQKIVQDICNRCGITLATTQIDNGGYVVSERPNDEALTCRDVLHYAAQISGSFARCDALGRMEFRWYNEKATKHKITAIKSFTPENQDIIITGIQVTDASDEKQSSLYGEKGYVLEVSDNPLIEAGKAPVVASYLGKKIIGMSFRPLDLTCILDPSAEAGDPAEVTDRKGKTYTCWITNMTYATGRDTKITCDAESPSDRAAVRFSEQTKAIIENRNKIKKERTERELALKNLSKQLAESSGMYITAEKQKDGSTIYYVHDKPTLAESMIVWKLTATALGISTDGGKTYPYGLDVSGKAILDRIYVIGINAENVKVESKKLTECIEEISSKASDASAAAKSATDATNAAVASVEVEYYKSTSPTQPTGGKWQTATPTWAEGSYIWSRTKTTTKGGTVAYSTPVCITGSTGASGTNGSKGDRGEKGDKGATGRGVKTIVPQYYLSTSSTKQEGGSWSATQPAWADGKYIWTRSYITWDDGTTSTTTPVLASALNGLGQDLASVKKTVSKQGSSLEVVENQIKEKVWKEDITTEIKKSREEIDKGIDQAQSTADQVSTTVTTVTTQVESLKTATEALSKAMQSYVKEDELETYKKQVESQLSQTPDAIEARFKTIEQNVSKVGSSSDDKWAQLETYIRLTQNGIALGKSDSPITLEIRNDRICFVQSGQTVAYYTNNQLYNSNLVVTTTANILGLVITKSGRHLRIS